MVTSGGLARVQSIFATYKNEDHQQGSNTSHATADDDERDDTASYANPSAAITAKKTKELYAAAKMSDSIRKINSCFPEEIVRYYTPGYSNTLLSKIDEYVAVSKSTTTGGSSGNHGKAVSVKDLAGAVSGKPKVASSRDQIARVSEAAQETEHETKAAVTASQ